MPSSVPTPVAAAIGLLPTFVAGVRRLPVKVVMLPVLAVGSALTALDNARQEYDELAERGEQVLSRLGLGQRVHDVEDRVQDVAEATVTVLTDRVPATVEQAADRLGDTAAMVARGAGDVLDTAARSLQDAGDALRDVPGPAPDEVATLPGLVAVRTELIEELPGPDPAQAPKGAPTPKATEPDRTRVDSAASDDVIQTVEQVAQAIVVPEVADRDQLPLADYDHMTLGSLRGRMRSLDVAQLVQLREYEKAHADRLPVVTMLDNRIAKLATDASATPSGGSQDGAAKPTGGIGPAGKVTGTPAARTPPSPPRGKVRLT